MLLRAGADARRANRYGVTPLQLAAVNGSVTAATALLEAGADPNAVLPEGETILMTAARTGQPALLRLLLDRGARRGRAREVVRRDGAHLGRGREPRRRREGAARAWRGRERPLGAARLCPPPHRPVGAVARQLDAVDVRGAGERHRAGSRARGREGRPERHRSGRRHRARHRHHQRQLRLRGAAARRRRRSRMSWTRKPAMGPLYAAIDMHRLAIGHGRPNPRPSGTLDARGHRPAAARSQGRPERAAQRGHLPAPPHDGRLRAGQGRDAVHACRQVGRRRDDEAAARGGRRSHGDDAEQVDRADVRRRSRLAGWQPGGAVVRPGHARGGGRRRSRCCSSAASISTPPTTTATPRCTWR